MKRNIFSFHGSDHKSGVTMISQSVSERICRDFPDKTVLFLGMNAGSSCEFVNEEIRSIEDIKLHIDNRTLTADEIKGMCYQKKNLYMIAGIGNYISRRNYFPETAAYLLDIVKGTFDVIICDTGNDIDNGLAFGALLCSDYRYCIVSQCESGLKAYENMRWIFGKLELEFDSLVVNKYFPKDPYDIGYISKRLAFSEKNVCAVRMAGYARQAEMEHRTLLDFRNSAYCKDITAISEAIAFLAGIEKGVKERKSLWKTDFISATQ